jgi:hypothetical protein
MAQCFADRKKVVKKLRFNAFSQQHMQDIQVIRLVYFLLSFKNYSPNATLRSAFSWKKFVSKIGNKNFTKKNFKKNFRKISVIFFFFGYRGFTSNLGCACKNLVCLGPLVWEEIDSAQNSSNPKTQI